MNTACTTIAAALFTLILAGCGPSCEEQGGEIVMQPTIFYNPALRAPVSQMVPVCKIDEKAR